jgi:hypothetical protein
VFHLFTATLNGTTTGTGILQIDGTTVATGTFTNPTSAGASPVYIFNYQAGAIMSGIVGDVYITTDCKTGSDLLNINRYFGYKYSISVP